MFNRRCCCNPNPCENQCEQRDPIMEPVMTSCIEREFYHTVPQD